MERQSLVQMQKIYTNREIKKSLLLLTLGRIFYSHSKTAQKMKHQLGYYSNAQITTLLMRLQDEKIIPLPSALNLCPQMLMNFL